jgi:hypothetical protein
VASYCYLGGDQPVTETRVLEPADLDRQQVLLEATLDAIGQGDYGRACGRPDCETCRRGLGPPTRPWFRTPPPAPGERGHGA